MYNYTKRVCSTQIKRVTRLYINYDEELVMSYFARGVQIYIIRFSKWIHLIGFALHSGPQLLATIPLIVLLTWITSK